MRRLSLQFRVLWRPHRVIGLDQWLWAFTIQPEWNWPAFSPSPVRPFDWQVDGV